MAAEWSYNGGGMSRSLESGLRPRLSLRTVLHYAACAFGTSIGVIGFAFSALLVLFGVSPEPPLGGLVFWLAFGGLFAWELLYRPATAMTAGIGACALILLIAWFAGYVVVASTLTLWS
jgi:hypothetical protein